MTDSTRQVSEHLMSLQPSVGFMGLPTTIKITVSLRTCPRLQTILWITVVLFTYQQQRNNTQYQKEERHTGKEVPNLVVFSLVPAQCYARYCGHGGVQFMSRVPHAPRTRLAPVSIRFGESTTAHSSRSSGCTFQFLASFLKSSALVRPWRCDSTLESHLDLPSPSRRVVFVQLHGYPAVLMLCPFPAAVGDERFCLHSATWCQCRLHCSLCLPSSVGSSPSRLLPDTRVL